MIRFLANENFPGPSVALIRQAGYYVSYIAEDNSGIFDPEVMKMATKENLVILTFDKDYGELIFKMDLTSPPSVIFFRFKGKEPDHAGRILLKQLTNNTEILSKSFTVIDVSGIRSRSY